MSESTADFKVRIAAIMRERETGKRYSVIGGPRADKSVLVKPKLLVDQKFAKK